MPVELESSGHATIAVSPGTRAHGGFHPAQPPFCAPRVQDCGDFSRWLLKDCVDVIADFIESGDPCWACDYAETAQSRPEGVREAIRIRNVMSSIAPKCVDVVRRSATLYLVRL